MSPGQFGRLAVSRCSRRRSSVFGTAGHRLPCASRLSLRLALVAAQVIDGKPVSGALFPCRTVGLPPAAAVAPVSFRLGDPGRMAKAGRSAVSFGKVAVVASCRPFGAHSGDAAVTLSVPSGEVSVAVSYCPPVRLPVLPSVRCDRLAMRPSERQVSLCVVRRGVRGGVLPVLPSVRCDRLAMRTSERQVSLCVVRRGVRGGVLPVLPSVRCDRLALRRRNNSCHAVSSLIMRRVFRQQTPRAAPRTTLSKQSNRPALKTSVSPA